MNTGIGTVAAHSFSGIYLFQIFGIVSLQCSKFILFLFGLTVGWLFLRLQLFFVYRTIRATFVDTVIVFCLKTNSSKTNHPVLETRVGVDTGTTSAENYSEIVKE
jgi:hypothetical protein